jgi:O-antigen/teichoic acid export membrane protein
MRMAYVAAAGSAIRSWMTAQGLAPGSVERRFATGVFWSLTATVASQALRMVTALVTARLLGRVGMGELGIVFSTLGAWGVFAGFGFGLTATKYVAEFRSSDPVRAGRILRLSTRGALLSSGVVSLVLFALADILAFRVLNAAHLTTELRLGSALLFFGAINGVQTGALAGFEAYRQIARIEFVRGVMLPPLVIAGLLAFDVPGVLAAHIITTAVGCWLARTAIRQECARSAIVTSDIDVRAELTIMRRFVIPAVLSSALFIPVIWLSNAILANQPDGYGELGLLSVANQWHGVLMFVPLAFLQVALPLLSHTDADRGGTAEKYTRPFVLTRSLTLLAVFPAGVFLMFMSTGIMRLYGRDFANGDVVLIGVVSTIMVMAIGSAAGPVIQAKGRLWLGFAQNASWGAMFVTLTFYTAPVWGAAGVAFSMGGSYVVLTIWSYLHLRSELPGGTVGRVMLGLSFVPLATTAAMTLPPATRVLLTLPAVMVTALVTFMILIDEPVRSVIRAKIRHMTTKLLSRNPR